MTRLLRQKYQKGNQKTGKLRLPNLKHQKTKAFRINFSKANEVFKISRIVPKKRRLFLRVL